jgi:hypothetical protein
MFTPRQYVENADVVVAGELVSTEQTPPNDKGVISSSDPTTYTVAVSAIYKGKPTSELSFRSAADGASCGVEGLKEGRKYVYFLDRSKGGYTANLCNGTGQVPEAKIAAITSPAQAPVPESTVIDEDLPAQNAVPWLYPTLGAGALVALGAALLGLRRRRAAKA